MDSDERVKLITGIGEEVIGKEELPKLLAEKKRPVAYNGFEPSGRMHIAQSLMFANNVNALTKAGCDVKLFVADWHAQANNKLGGDLEKIQTTGKYFIEVWKACGMDLDHVEFIWASDLVKDPDYWQLVLKIGTINSVDRIKRCSQIMGRSDEDALSAAQILYPLMQCADIFHMGIDICQLGMDQRKVNVLAREVAEKLGKKKPIVVSHHMLLGLTEPPKNIKGSITIRKGSIASVGQVPEFLQVQRIDPVLKTVTLVWENKYTKKIENIRFDYPRNENGAPDTPFGPDSHFTKMWVEEVDKSESVTIGFIRKLSSSERTTAMKMSKSRPDSAVFSDDTEEDVQRKLKNAYCPAKQAEENPVLEYCEHIIFPRIEEFRITRPEKFGGDIAFASYEDLKRAFVAGDVHPMDLKTATAAALNELLEPIRKHFSKGKPKQLKEAVAEFSVTR